MDSDGVTVRPLAHMLGEAEFNEVFLDDVFLPDDAVVGAVDGGWKVAMATLAFERVAIATGRGAAVAAARPPGPGHRHRRRVHLHPAQHRRRAHPRPAPWLSQPQSPGTSTAVRSSTSEIASV
jgi:alkylation response protein AidB-like acyl-CoA dehydrogenase